jgi:AGZA family xanthine/uracil permease-like MFS transporter
MLERLFQLRSNGTTIRSELVAGMTTFAAMAYILAVNPAILSDGTGMDRGALITATALSSALITGLMALLTNYPFAVAPGMGLNAFFTFTLVRGAGIPWPAALGIVFYSGILFLLLTITGLRARLIRSLPHELKVATSAGIGLFIAFIGLQNGGVVVHHDATLVTLGNLKQPAVLTVIAGIILAGVLCHRRAPGALFITLLGITAAGFWIPNASGSGVLTRLPDSGNWISRPPSLEPLFLKFDLGWFWSHWRQALPLVLTLLFLDVFDNLGTLIGLGQRAGYLDEHGNLPRLGRVLTADAGAAIVGSALGTSTVTSYIESAAGIESGGRTGLTGIAVAGCFLLSLFISPLIGIIPTAATAPVLVVVGILMMQGLCSLDLEDLSKAIPVGVTVVAMPLTFSIAEGLALGFVVHVGILIGLGRHRQIQPLAWVLTLLFIAQWMTR